MQVAGVTPKTLLSVDQLDEKQPDLEAALTSCVAMSILQVDVQYQDLAAVPFTELMTMLCVIRSCHVVLLSCARQRIRTL